MCGRYASFREDQQIADEFAIASVADDVRLLPPSWNLNDGSIDMYYWFYGSLAMFQVGGYGWERWQKALDGALIPNQRMDGTYCGFKGSWDPVDPWGPDGGRVYSTALMTMCCEVSWRYARVAEAR